MFCASQAAMDETSSSSAVRLGGKAIDRHNPIIRDGRRFTPPPSPNPKSSSSHQTQKTKLGLNTHGDHLDKTQEQNQSTRKKKNKKSNNKKGLGNSGIATPQGSSRYLLDDPVFFDGFVDSDPVKVPADPVFTDGFVDSDPVKVPVDRVDEKIEPVPDYNEDRLIINASKYLSSSFLEEKKPDFFDGFLDYDPVLSPDNSIPHLTRTSPSELCCEDKHVSPEDVQIQASPPPPPPPPPPTPPPLQQKKPSSDQVVVLRVSLHCKGCAGKVRKHLSRMKGVTSFNVDFAAKKVTVTGDVTPLGVLASVSKVKNAQFWPETTK